METIKSKKRILFYLPIKDYVTNRYINLVEKFLSEGWYVCVLSNEKKYLERFKKIGCDTAYFNDFLKFNSLIFKTRVKLFKIIPLAVVLYDYFILWYWKILLPRIIKRKNVKAGFITWDTEFEPSLILAQMKDFKTIIVQNSLDSTDAEKLIDIVLGPKFKLDKLKGFKKILYYGIIKKFFPGYTVRFMGHEVLGFKNPYVFLTTILHGIKMTSIRKGGGGADYVFIQGEAYKDIFRQYGIDPQKLVLTGSQDYDPVYEYKKNSNRQDVSDLKKRFSIGPNDSVVVFFSQMTDRSPDRYIAHIENLFKECREIVPNLKFIVKLHPRLEGDFYSLEKKNKNLFVVSKPSDNTLNFRLALLSSLCVCEGSTLAFSITALEKNLLLYEYQFSRSYSWFKSIDSSKVVSGNEAELARHMLSRLKDKKVKNIDLKRWCIVDGKCADRMVKETENILKKL